MSLGIIALQSGGVSPTDLVDYPEVYTLVSDVNWLLLLLTIEKTNFECRGANIDSDESLCHL